MKTVTLEALLEAGCHFGHQVARQNSKARDYIFEARDGIHIIDLEKTKEGLEDAAKFIKEIATKNGTLLVLGTKRQAEGVLREELKRVKAADNLGLYYVTKRWIGGTLTNASEVGKNYKKLKDLTSRLQDKNARAGYTKKEIGDWDKERQKLESFYGGVADMTKAPDAIFIVDTHHEHVAARESLSVNIPTIGITDTNADPQIITYPIPANDDAVGSLKLIISHILDAWVEGREQAGKDAVEVAKVEAAKAEKAEAASNAVDSEPKEATSDVAEPKEKKVEEKVKVSEKKKEVKAKEAKQVVEKVAPKKKVAEKKEKAA